METFYWIILASATKREAWTGNSIFFKMSVRATTRTGHFLCAHVQVSKQNESLSLSLFASLEGSRRRSYLARTFAAVYHCKHQHKCERMPHVVAVTVKPGGPSIATCLDDAAHLAEYSVWEVEINQPLSINVVPLV